MKISSAAAITPGIDNGNVTLVSRIASGNAHNLVINPESPFLYIAVGGPLEVWSLADPANPVDRKSVV